MLSVTALIIATSWCKINLPVVQVSVFDFAGIGSFTIVDNNKVTGEDVGCK